MHFSFSAVNENADENEIPFSAGKQKRKSPAYITELSYGSIANITFSTQRKCFWNENEKYNENENSFSAENEKSQK